MKALAIVIHRDGSFQSFNGYDVDCIAGLGLSALNTGNMACSLHVYRGVLGSMKLVASAKGVSGGFARLERVAS